MLVGQSVWGCKACILFFTAPVLFVDLSRSLFFCLEAFAHVSVYICFHEKERKKTSMLVCMHMFVYRMFIHARGMSLDNRLQEIVLCVCVYVYVNQA